MVCAKLCEAMNQRIYQRALEISRALKPKVQSGKSHHVCFLIRKSKIICIGVNNYKKTHNQNRFGVYQNHKGFKTEYRPCVHAEGNLLIKNGETDISDCELLNIRIDNSGKPNMAKPCLNCFGVLSSLDGPPKKVFYSDEGGECKQDERF